MSGGLVLVLVLVAAGVVIAVVATKHNRRATVMRSYGRFAEELGGVVRLGGWFERPTIEFRHRGVAARLEVQAAGGNNHRGHYTQLRFNWHDPTLRCEVFRAGILSRLSRLMGMNDVETGSAQFDAKYAVHGTAPDRIRALMSAGVQVAIDRIQRSLFGGDVYVSWGGGQLVIKKRGYLREYRDVRQFVRLGLDLYDQAASAGDAGITFLDAAEQELAEFVEVMDGRTAVCCVCGEEITDRVVHCRSCRTPHHEDCWKYFGACSTYGCGERRFRRPRAKT